MKPGTQADIVREFGCSRNAISLLVKAKDYRIIKTPGGKIDVDSTVEALRKSGFGKRSDMIKRKKKALKDKPAKPAPPTSEEHEDDIETVGPLTLSDKRDRIEKHLAFHKSEKERINNEKALKKLISIIDVGDKSFNLWRQVREEIQALKDRIAIKVRAAETDHEAEQIVHDETHRILTSIIGGYETLDDAGLKKKLLTRLIK